MLNKNFDTPTSSSYIAAVDIKTRGDFLLKNSQEFQIPIKWKYRGTEKQNIALLKFLEESPDFKKKWESELLNIKNTVDQKKSEINQPRIELSKAVTAKEGTVLHGVTTSAYTHSEDPRWGKWTSINGTVKYNNGTDPNNPISCSTNWAKWPPGTKLRIDGKHYAVHDYGSFVTDYPNRIDLYVPTKWAVILWLLKKKDITVLEMGDFNKARKLLSEPARQKFAFVRKMLADLPT